MANSKQARESSSGMFPMWITEIVQKIFFVALLITVGLFGYLLYGLFTGQLADASSGPRTDQQHAMALVSSLSNYLDLSLVVTLVSAVILFYDEELAGIVLLLIAAFLAYGLKFSIDFLFAQDAARLTTGKLSELTLKQLQATAEIIAVPGVLIFLRNIFVRIIEGRQGPDLTNVKYGKTVNKEEVPGAFIGALAKCWQLPFCREGIRVKCPIFHARTKCWKQRVGCMCEENIIRLASGGEEHKPVDMTKQAGFVPIGDLISKSDAAARPNITTRIGPRGVKIPTNPHITEWQKRERCRNCVIYNEHQRQKYNVLSPLVTIIVPVFVFLEFDTLRHWLGTALTSLDSLIGHMQFKPVGEHPLAGQINEITNSLFVEGFILVCFTLMMMTWALRLLEYCTFKIKI